MKTEGPSRRSEIRDIGNAPIRTLHVFEGASAIVTGGAFARRVRDAVTKNKAIIVIPSWWKLFWYVDRHFPSLAMALARRSFRDLQEINEGQVQ